VGRPATHDIESLLEDGLAWMVWFRRLPTSTDWRRSHAERHGGRLAEAHRVRRWPSSSAVYRVFGSWPEFQICVLEMQRLCHFSTVARIHTQAALLEQFSEWWAQLPPEGQRARPSWALAHFAMRTIRESSEWDDPFPDDESPDQRDWWANDWSSDHFARWRYLDK